MESMEQTQKAPRRTWFRRVVLGTLGAAAAVGIGAAAFGHGGQGGFAERLRDPARLDRMLQHLYVEIDATDEQKQKIKPIVSRAVNDLLPLHEKLHAARTRAIDLVRAPSVDRAAIESLRAEQLQLADQASRRLTQALADLAEVLTPEQRRDIAERMSRRHGRWHRG